MLQGIALGGFNVVDIHGFYRSLNIPVLVVARRAPRMEMIGKRKWTLIEKAGPMEPVDGVFVQRAGLSLDLAGQVIRRFSVYGSIPEPLRVAHLEALPARSGAVHRMIL
jgi:uncharacterized protein